jgi:dUTP pyrophosphatase
MNATPIFRFAIRKDLEDVEDTFMPVRATPDSAGWDVKAAPPSRQPLLIRTGEIVKIPLGFRTFCPPGWWFELKPRSSTFAKKQLHCLYGTIDEDYEGELILAAQFLPNLLGYYDNCAFGSGLEINFGDAIGQIIPVKRQEMITMKISNDEFDTICKLRNAGRGAGGFGSTDGK